MSARHQGGHRYDVIVVGSGMGGAVLVRELAKAGRDVLVVEAGMPRSHLGTFSDALQCYDGDALTKVPRRSREGVIVYRALVPGGSSLVSCGNGVRCLEREIAEFVPDLEGDVCRMEAEMCITPLGADKYSDMSTRILEASHRLGYTFGPMPKMVDQTKCTACGCCVLGCPSDAKWTAARPLHEAIELGADFRYGTTVEQVLHANGHVSGVHGTGPDGEFEARADIVVLAAGGLGTPGILLASGVQEASKQLFIDMFVNVYGVLDEPARTVEPQMALVDTEFHDERGFLMAPFINYPRGIRMIEGGPGLAARPVRRLFGMMVKTTDDRVGEVFPDGTLSKPVTDADKMRLEDGAAVATQVLVAAGVNRASVTVSKPQGAHPGGTAAIGQVVDGDLQTRIDGLFVSDASVLPETPGMPPLVLIGALARRLGRKLASV